MRSSTHEQQASPHWTKLIRSSPLKKHGELVTLLKTEHAMGHGHANAIVAHTLAQCMKAVKWLRVWTSTAWVKLQSIGKRPNASAATCGSAAIEID